MFIVREVVVWGIAVLVVLGVGVTAMGGLSRVGLAAPNEVIVTRSDVVSRVLAYADGMQPDDRLIQVQEGVWVKASNYYGVAIGGVRYYYAIGPHASFDPLSRGVVSRAQIQVVYEDRSPEFDLLIYVIPDPPYNMSLGS